MKIFKRLLLLMAMLMMAGVAFAQTWTNTSAPLLWYSLASSADGTKLFATTHDGSGAFYTSTNSGAVWTQISFPDPNWVHVAASADGTKVLAAASDFGVAAWVYVSTNSGATWSSNSTPKADFWWSAASSADGTKLVVAGQIAGPNRGVVYTSADAGNTWVSNNLPVVPPSWYSVASSADGNKLVVVAQTGQICTSTNAGVTWQPPFNAPSTNNSWNSVAASADGSKLVAVSFYLKPPFTGNYYPSNNAGSICTSTDSGMNWTSNNVPNDVVWSGVASSADGTKLVAVGYTNSPDYHGGEVAISTNGGKTWTVQLRGESGLGGGAAGSPFTTVVLSADGNRLCAHEGGGYYAVNCLIHTAYWPPSSVLNFTPSPTSLTLAWTVPSTNFTLQTSADLVSWSDVTNPPVLNPTNVQNQVTLPSSGSSGFFRLTTP